MATRVWWSLFLTSSAVVMTGCGALVALDHYRECQGAEECVRASGDAAALEAAPDADAEAAPPTSCMSGSMCPPSAPVCDPDVHQCLTVDSLVRGTSGHVCVLVNQTKTTKSLWCWGINATGKVGANSAKSVITAPTKIALPNDAPVAQAMTSGAATCALTGGQYPQVYCWGDAPGASVNSARHESGLNSASSAQ